MSAFAKLAAIDCSQFVDKKGRFSYLSWPFAVRMLRENAPDATWEVKRFDGLPFQKTDAGTFVEVAVTVEGVTLSQIHPVLNGTNKPIDNPDAFDINTSIQRALVKAIALHGLGLYIYAGEDLPTTVAVRLTADELVAINKDIESAPDIDSLRLSVADGLNRALDDSSAYEKIKQWGITASAKFGASAPEREPVKAKSETVNQETGEVSDVTVVKNGKTVESKVAPAGLIRILKAKAAARGITEQQLLATHEIEKLDGISVELGNHILKSLNA